MQDYFKDSLPKQLLDLCRRQNLKISTVESCTGGMIAAAFTAIAGSSEIFEYGFVTYSNEAKTKLVGVPESILKEFGAVSAQTAKAMAEGALHVSGADIAISCTGIAGPGGGSAEKPVGLVFIGLAMKDKPTHTYRHVFDGNRDAVRQNTVTNAIEHALERLECCV